MRHPLVDVMSELTSLSPTEERDIAGSFPVRSFPAGTLLLRAGQIPRCGYFVVAGCIRAYRLTDGVEQTTAFYLEKQTAVDFTGLNGQVPTKLHFVCAEDVTVAVFSPEREAALYAKHPRFEAFCRAGVERMLGERQEEVAALRTLKPTQRYRKLREEQPELLQRVPQHQLASYLGVTPETLSRIRRRLGSSGKPLL